MSPTTGTTSIALPFVSGGLAATQFSSGIALYSHGLLSSGVPLISATRRLNAIRLPTLSIRPASSDAFDRRSDEHTSELQSLMRISYAVFCLNKKLLDSMQLQTPLA